MVDCCRMIASRRIVSLSFTFGLELLVDYNIWVCDTSKLEVFRSYDGKFKPRL
jgi:hypothetical protein